MIEEVTRANSLFLSGRAPRVRGGRRLPYPLTDFKPRAGLNWERRYLGGSIGAVPFLNEEDFVTAVEERGSTPRG